LVDDEVVAIPAASEPTQPVTVRVDRWTIRIRRIPPAASLLGVVAIGGFTWILGFRRWALALGLVALVVPNVQNRYVVVEAELGTTLWLRYLGGRERTLRPGELRLSGRSPWRVCFFGGLPLVGRPGWKCVGAFYPTLGWHDLDAFNRRLQSADVAT
jgi:hypothetical protein